MEDSWLLLADLERFWPWRPKSITGEFRTGGQFGMKDGACGRFCAASRRASSGFVGYMRNDDGDRAPIGASTLPTRAWGAPKA
jgi:hypothetical protein